MSKLKKLIPLWIKSPISIFLHEITKFPLDIVICHIFKGFADGFNNSTLLQKKVNKLEKDKIYKYMEKKYQKYIIDISVKQSNMIKEPNSPIWIFWWQGENNAPQIVKKCISSVRKHAGRHSLIVIDSQNYDKYINIPSHILEKFNKNIISITHFSDYYRMALLAEYGGLWIDGSIFLSKKIDDTIFELPIFSIKNPNLDDSNISDWNWTVGVIGGWKNNKLFSIVRDLLSMYWNEHDNIIDYFIFDYMVKLVYENCEEVKEMISLINPNNSHFYFFQNNANKKYDDIEFNKVIQSNTSFFKISWKGNYMSKTKNGNTTYISKLLDIEEFHK